MKNQLRLLTCTVTFILLTALAPKNGLSGASETFHSGGTDKCGCHYNRKTGEYHCHKRKKRGGDCPE